MDILSNILKPRFIDFIKEAIAFLDEKCLDILKINLSRSVGTMAGFLVRETPERVNKNPNNFGNLWLK
jgi:hypothetical protein